MYYEPSYIGWDWWGWQTPTGNTIEERRFVVIVANDQILEGKVSKQVMSKRCRKVVNPLIGKDAHLVFRRSGGSSCHITRFDNWKDKKINSFTAPELTCDHWRAKSHSVLFRCCMLHCTSILLPHHWPTYTHNSESMSRYRSVGRFVDSWTVFSTNDIIVNNGCDGYGWCSKLELWTSSSTSTHQRLLVWMNNEIY